MNADDARNNAALELQRLFLLDNERIYVIDVRYDAQVTTIRVRTRYTHHKQQTVWVRVASPRLIHVVRVPGGRTMSTYSVAEAHAIVRKVYYGE